MTIKMRLALLFTFLVACILATFTWAVYTYSSYQRSKGFFAQLQTDAIASATITLRSDNLSEAALEPFHRKLQEKLPLENVDIFDKNHVSVFHAGDRHLQLDDEAAEAANRLGLYTKTVGDTQKVFFPFDDEDVHYVVAISAVDFPGLANLYKLRLGLIAALAASLVIVFVAGVWFAGRAMAPIVSITRQAEGISAAGLHVRIAEGPQKDELTQLAHAFNQMLNRLEDAFQAQKQFLANVSHELRTPLTTLEGQLEQMREDVQARGAEELAIHRSKDDETSKLRGELAKKLTESQAAQDALSKAEELQLQTQEKLQSVTSEFEEVKRALSQKTAEIESNQAIIGEKDKSIAKLNDELKTLRAAAQNTQSPSTTSQTLVDEPDRIDASTPPPEGRPESIRSNSAGKMGTLLDSTGIFSKTFFPRRAPQQKRKTFYSVAQDIMKMGNGSSAGGVE